MAGSLSGREQQMVAIGCALRAGPQILMLDEPLLGIAPKAIAGIADAIVQRNKETGASVTLVEQNVCLALQLHHHAYVYGQGEITRSGCGQEMLADPFVQKTFLGT